jgi:exodeoxyribonuclease-3
MRTKQTTGESTLTVLSWNLENFTRYGGDKAATPLQTIVSDFERPDIVCLQEIRVRPQDDALISHLESALPGYHCHFSLARDAKNVTFRGGRAYGVVTYVRAELQPFDCKLFDEDREGRVVLIELPKLRIALFNLYAVNGTSKPYFDHALGRMNGDRHAFKRRFQTFLQAQAAQCLQSGLELVMIGDWNVSRTGADIFPRLRTARPHTLARKQLNQEFMPALDLVDAFRELHPSERKYTWFNRMVPPGTLDAARVDYALVSRPLLPRVIAAEIFDAKQQRHGSDHAPLLLKLAV